MNTVSLAQSCASVVETLESRRLLAAQLLLDGTLLVTGTNQADVITLALNATDATVLDVTQNGVTDQFEVASVTGIVVAGKRGADQISFDETNGAIDINAVLGGGQGSDSITGGSGDDLINGGQGFDSLVGGAGDDTVTGGQGLDSIDGGADADLLIGGQGGDSLLGGAGADTLLGRQGADMLDGGEDNDSVFGGQGLDTLMGGLGDDSLVGGQGNDSLDGGDGVDAIFGGNGNDDFAAGDSAEEKKDEGLDDLDEGEHVLI